eukprot:6146817-Prymnesium_polylepis.2
MSQREEEPGERTKPTSEMRAGQSAAGCSHPYMQWRHSPPSSTTVAASRIRVGPTALNKVVSRVPPLSDSAQRRSTSYTVVAGCSGL